MLERIVRLLYGCICQPSNLRVYIRRLIPFRAILNDRELYHIISAWSSGTAKRMTLDAIFPNIPRHDFHLLKIYSRKIGWSVDVPELSAMLAIIMELRPKRILEVGTFDGLTALNFAANAPRDAVVVTIDLPPDYKGSSRISNAADYFIIGKKFKGTPYEASICQVYANSVELNWDDLGDPFDFIFIDGCHDYNFVLSDSRHAIEHIRPGGVIVWHDYGMFQSVSRAVDEMSKEIEIVALYGTRLAIGLRRSMHD